MTDAFQDLEAQENNKNAADIRLDYIAKQCTCLNSAEQLKTQTQDQVQASTSLPQANILSLLCLRPTAKTPDASASLIHLLFFKSH